MNKISVYEKIDKLKGVGEKTALLYDKVGISNIDDLLHYYPRDYIKYDKVINGDEFVVNTICTFEGVVLKRPLTKRVKKLQITSTSLNCDGILVTATWFHMPFLSKSLTVGKKYVFRGKLTPQGDHYHMEQAQIFTVDAYEELVEKIAPLYSLTKGLSNNAITKSVKIAFDSVDNTEYEERLYDLHFPDSMDSLVKAREALVFDEFLLFILRLRKLKAGNEKAHNDFDILEVAQTNRIIEKLPFRLTNAQLKVWDEIKNDLQSGISMRRLVQGDVGSGKTIVSILASIMVACNGYQAAIMAPTEILASQHFETFSKIIKDNSLNIEAVLLTGSISESNKKKIREKIGDGSTKIIIGTHALIQEKVVYNKLALVVTDEQHRFGVMQREELINKNDESSPHVLVMSATPIPRTLAIIVYGDLSISIIDEVPAHKKPIKNAVVGEGYRKKAYDFIKKEIEEGHQAYIICPLVEESEGLDAKDVVGYTNELSAIFPDTIRIGCLYGKMKPSEKQRVMDEFANNNIHILVSTTVVEVGVNVPNATVMLIENAERFGLAQLHQLRGRIGRGQAQSYCIFMNGNDSKKSLERLEILSKTNDGFKIAEEDLKLRGPGDLFGLRQSGDIEFKLADIFTDAKILKMASEKADQIIQEDPNLDMPEHSKLKKLMKKSYMGNDLAESI